MTADHGFAGLDVTQLAADGATVGRHDDGVHALLFNFHPRAADTHVRPMVRRGVEIIRHAAIFLGWFDQRIALADGMTAERGELLQQLGQRLGIGRRDSHLDPRGVIVGPADVEVENLVGGLLLDDLVEDRRQKP